MKKRVLSLVLTFMMLASMCVVAPFHVSAETNSTTKMKAYEGHAYQVYDRKVTWEEAEAFCEKQGGYLATIANEEEQAFVSGMIIDYGAACWVGARRTENSRDFEWVTGEPFSYTNWDIDEPSYIFQNEQELYMGVYANDTATEYSTTAKWNDFRKNTPTIKGFICEWEDSDGDMLPDVWERNGVDVDGDGVIDVDLPAMGANPEKCDIFVEVDWMHKPEEKVNGIIVSESFDFKPSESAMREVWQSFNEFGINIHIDCGPDSTDFVTGKKWGELSRGSQIAYKRDFNVGDNYENWDTSLKANFDANRRKVFHHCLFVNSYTYGDIKNSSGLSYGIPGNAFIVARYEFNWKGGKTGYGMNDKQVAGTFMHELGHNLGLCHGGGDHTGYKPNYLSIMNYHFQFTGLVGTDKITYSNYELPTIDETRLDESTGLDPEGITASEGLGTRFYAPGQIFASTIVHNIAQNSIDYNRNNSIDTSVSLDINNDGKTNIMPGYRDWNNIDYTGIVNNYFSAGDAGKNFRAESQEISVETAIKQNVYAKDGDGSVEFAGPYTVFYDAEENKLCFDIVNLSSNDTEFEFAVEDNSLTGYYYEKVAVSGSKDNISSVRVMVPVKKAVECGEYTFNVTIFNTAIRKQLPCTVEVIELSEERMSEYIELIDNGSFDGMDADVLAQFKEVIGYGDIKTSFGSSVSDWAKTEVEEAYDVNLVPEVLVGKDLTQKVDRAEFAAIAVALYENLTGSKATKSNNPFFDIYGNACEDAILKAYNLDITMGTSATTFDPDSNITREQMATMLTRAYKKSEFKDWTIAKDADYPLNFMGVVKFADDNEISDYAKESVYFMARWEIIKGVGDNKFAPKNSVAFGESYGYATREQAIIIALRSTKHL